MTSVYNSARVRAANDRAVNEAGRYVLYWCQMFRRLRANHALNYAAGWAAKLKKPLVVYEGLKLNYPWASARFHKYMLEGMRDSAAAAKELGVSYWPFVETPDDPGRGLVRRLCADACLLVTDDYPQFIIPAQIRAVAAAVDVPVYAIDGNGVVPLGLLGKPTAAAAHLRPKLHKNFPLAWEHRAAAVPDLPKPARVAVDPPFTVWKPAKDLGAFVATLPVDQAVPPAPGVEGGSVAGHARLKAFAQTALGKYADGRSQPAGPDGPSSALSAFLHYGHLGIQEVVEAVLGPDWSPDQINPKTRNKDDFFTRDPNVNGFLDEAITWRDVGYQWHFSSGQRTAAGGPNQTWQVAGEVPAFNFDTFDFSPSRGGVLDRVLPDWAKATLDKHRGDERPETYTLEQLEHADTKDEVWNAGQREMVATGRMHNYLRMLWGKKVLQWSPTPEEAYRRLEHLNNKYQYDGRDPNSYTGILWVFGLFDRPWPPERPIFGNLRYMTSESTAKKFKLAGYYEYVRSLPRPRQVRAGTTAPTPPGKLF
jgi:deoxyribodipyrimidine photo-lyase